MDLHQLLRPFAWLFDTTGFVPRWQCGLWSAQLGWLHILSDSLIWLAYMAIPGLLVFFLRRRRDMPFPKVVWLFGAFIVACGMTHFIEAVVFWNPVYRLAGVVKLMTATISWITVFALVRTLPQALAMRTPTELELEVKARTAELTRVNETLRLEVEERLRVEQRIRQQQERLQVILGSIGEGIVATEGHGLVTLFNPAAEQLTGVPQSEAIGLSLDKVLRTRWNSNGMNGDATNGNRSARLEGRFLTHTVLVSRDGTERIVEQRWNPIRADASQIAGYVLTLQDITERTQSEESLRLRDRAIGAASQGILITDASLPDNPIVFASAGFERITGYRPEEVLGQNCRFLQGPDSDQDSVRRLREAINTATPFTEELLNYRKDGTAFWLELSISPVRDDSGKLTHFVGVQTDITSRKSLEDQLRQSQKMESIGRLAGGVAHDFNNMLTVINGCCDLAMNELVDHAPTAPLLREIRSAGERAANLTKQLLALSRRQRIVPQALEFNQIVAEMEQMLVRLLGDKIRLQLDLAPDLWPVRGNRGRKEQVLLNLVVNGRDAMPNGGTLSISTRNQSPTDRPPSALAGQPGSFVILEVTDTGVGIPDDARPHIFEPFFTTKATGSGSGMGLTVVHGIVTQAGGHIEFHSQPGQGTTFRVYFPRAADAPPIEAALQPQLEAAGLPHGSETVLIVEDERSVRLLLETTLRRCGYQVLVANHGAHAVQLLAEHAGEIDLLITDVIMPEIGGGDVAREYLKLHQHGTVLFISGFTDDAVLQSGVEFNDMNFLEKPFPPGTLARKVREALDR